MPSGPGDSDTGVEATTAGLAMATDFSTQMPWTTPAVIWSLSCRLPVQASVELPPLETSSSCWPNRVANCPGSTESQIVRSAADDTQTAGGGEPPPSRPFTWATVLA